MLLTTLHSFALVAGRIRQPRGSTLSFSSVESNADVPRPLTLVKFNYDGPPGIIYACAKSLQWGVNGVE